jgi:small conductance mechanosensitive channel
MDYIRSESGDLAEHLEEYSYLVADVLWVIALGALAVYLLHRLASGFLYSVVSNSRAIRVMFGALYVLVLVAAILGALRKMGLAIDTIGSIAVLTVLVLAVLIYFIIPFLPRLPFVVGHTVETNGIMGTVDQVSSFHTTIRKFDGTLVFLPNALVMASKILNYSYTPSRRIEMQLNLPSDQDLQPIRERVLALVGEDERVLADPSPPAAFVMSADAAAVHMTVYCWVRNEDFLGARSDLWQKLMALRESRGVDLPLALPRQVIEVAGGRPVAGEVHGG